MGRRGLRAFRVPTAGGSPVLVERAANALVGRLGVAAGGVEARALEDGRIALLLPSTLAHVLLAQLRAQAEELRDTLRRAAQQDAIRQVEARVASGEWRAHGSRSRRPSSPNTSGWWRATCRTARRCTD